MLFKSVVLEAIRAGRVTLAFRRWPKPRVTAGSRIRTAIGVIAVTGIDKIALTSVSEGDARQAGYEDRAALLAEIRRFGEGSLFRIGLSFAGEDPRQDLRDRKPSSDELAEIRRQLQRLDKAAKDGPWTMKVLRLIARHPERRAGDLAAELGSETLPFKVRVRKLKELGLTESLDVGYRISPRGARYLKTLAPRDEG